MYVFTKVVSIPHPSPRNAKSAGNWKEIVKNDLKSFGVLDLFFNQKEQNPFVTVEFAGEVLASCVMVLFMKTKLVSEHSYFTGANSLNGQHLPFNLPVSSGSSKDG